MSFLKYNGIDVSISDLTNVDIAYCRQLVEAASFKQLCVLKELVAKKSTNELETILEANTDFNSSFYNSTPRLPKTPANSPKEPSNATFSSSTDSLNNDLKILNDLLKGNDAQVVSSDNATTKVKMPDGSIKEVPTKQLDSAAIKDNTEIQSGNRANPKDKKPSLGSYIASQYKAGKTPSGGFETRGDGKGLIANATKMVANTAAGALRDSVEPNDDVLEEMGEIVRLAGINGKNENCAGSKAAMPSIIGNTSNSHRPTVKLGHELRKERVAKERMKDNKFKKE